ncbi:MAG: GNAT family N-acetyltransferase [Anaerolineae bacterium]|nr:GNAT family N-acetyltransferase [Anaerolineae bacterium]
MSASPTVTIRPARAEDFPQVQAICAQIWEGHDYVPDVWTQWLADAEGELAVLTVGDAVGGIGKLTRLGAGEWWLEGLRIDPAQRNRGYGMMLHRHLVEVCRARGGGVARFATGSTNIAVHTMAHEIGFKRRAAFVRYEAGPQAHGADEFRPLAPAEAAQVWDFLNGSEYFEAAQRSFELPRSWTWMVATEARLLDLLHAGQVYGWFGDRRATALDGVVIAHTPSVDRHDGQSRLSLAYFDVTVGNLAIAAQMFRAVVGQAGVDKVQLRTLSRPERKVALEQAGYRRDSDYETWLFALEIEGA